MKLLFEAIKNFCLTHGFNRTYWIALSGGLDSTVLLDLLTHARSFFPLKLHVVHVNHGLSSNANSWMQHCKSLCEEYGVEFTAYSIQINLKSGQSLEAFARQKRYEIFEKKIHRDDILLTAHNQDDQAETFLLQLFRGAGLKGLSSMPELIAFGQGFHARPLLGFSREVLQEYAEQHQLNWIEDESNANTDFTRNFIRHEVTSLLKKRWPNVNETIARSAHHCAEAQELLDEFSQLYLISCYGSQPSTLSISKLLKLAAEKQRQIIRYWLSENGFSIPSTVKMQHIMQDMLHARIDKLPVVAWGNTELRRYQDDLYVMHKLLDHNKSQIWEWDFSQPLDLPGIGVLCASSVVGEGLRANVSQVTVRFRSGGEDFRLPGRTHHHSLKKLFQTWKIPSWKRDRVPLLFVGEQLAAIVGYYTAESFQAVDRQEGIIFSIKI